MSDMDSGNVNDWLRRGWPDLKQAREEIAALSARVAELERLLKECAEDLAEELDARYPENIRRHPGMRRRYDRDMEPVIRARAALAQESGK